MAGLLTGLHLKLESLAFSLSDFSSVFAGGLGDALVCCKRSFLVCGQRGVTKGGQRNFCPSEAI